MDVEMLRISKKARFEVGTFDKYHAIYIHQELKLLFIGACDQLMAVEIDSLHIIARFKCKQLPKSIDIAEDS